MKLSFIGLGVMGYPMAGHLQNAGHDVTVYNRTTAKAEKWAAEYGGSVGLTPAEAAAGADIVFMCVGNDNDLREVSMGDNGTLKGMSAGSLLVDHTTASATVAEELLAAANNLNIGFIDAPVSGGEAGAVNGKLTIMCGGSDADYARAEPVMDAYSLKTIHMGKVGSGQLTKMCNQIAIAGAVQGVAESLHLAQKSGLDVEKAISILQKGSAGSWFMENRAHTMNKGQFDFGFAIDWMRKDLGMAFDQARTSGATLPTAALIDQFFADVQTNGGGRHDVSALITRLK